VDCVLLVGKFEDRLFRLLKVLGYLTLSVDTLAELDSTIEQNRVDLIVLDDQLNVEFVELCRYLRDYQDYKETPLVILTKDQSLRSMIEKEAFSRIEMLSPELSPGQMASKMATLLRLRKFDGEDEKASLADMNAALRSHNQHMLRELEEARRIQTSLLPASLPANPSFDLAISFEPLEEVGGDWFFVEQIDDDNIQVYIADVTGHGLAAAFVSSMTKLAMTAAGGDTPSEKIAKMNQLISPQLSDGRFITLFCYRYQISTGTVEFVRAGHPPGLLHKRESGEVRLLKGEGFALGFFDDAEYVSEQEMLEIGDVLLVMTDGYPEAQDRSNQHYGYDRMISILKDQSESASSQDILAAIIDDFSKFLGGRILKDDLTIIALKRLK